LAWYPKLLHGRPGEGHTWRLIGQGDGIHWPQLDKDVKVENIVFGQPSGESQTSLARWLAAAKTGPVTLRRQEAVRRCCISPKGALN
jgi:hypothetical protein